MVFYYCCVPLAVPKRPEGPAHNSRRGAATLGPWPAHPIPIQFPLKLIHQQRLWSATATGPANLRYAGS